MWDVHVWLYHLPNKQVSYAIKKYILANRVLASPGKGHPETIFSFCVSVSNNEEHQKQQKCCTHIIGSLCFSTDITVELILVQRLHWWSIQRGGREGRTIKKGKEVRKGPHTQKHCHNHTHSFTLTIITVYSWSLFLQRREWIVKEHTNTSTEYNDNW